VSGIFRSLRSPNYRIWAAGALVSNIGSWMQRTAQDWIVLTELTDHSATAIGIVMGLQFGPQILLLPLTGFAADHLNRRKVLFCTQGAMGLLALVLGLLVVTGLVRLWHVYIFAFLLGCAAAFDSPARQTFVSELVDEKHLPNAVALNSTSFNAARMIGPAIAGGLIAAVGSGWVFLLNALSFVAVLGSLAFLRTRQPSHRPARTRGSLLEGFRYVWQRPDLKTVLLMLFLIGTFMLRLRAPTRATVRADLRHECGRYLRSSGGALCRHGSTSQAGLFGDLQPDVDLAKNDIPRPENQTHLSPRCVCCGAAFRHVALLTHRA